MAIHAVSVCAPLSFSSTLNESSVSIDVSHYWPSNDVGVREMTLSGGQTKLFVGVPFTSVFVAQLSPVIIASYVRHMEWVYPKKPMSKW